MMNKLYISLLLFYSLQFSLHAQNNKLKKINTYFLNRAYVKTAQVLKETAVDYDALIILADSYYYNGLMKKACSTYQKASLKNNKGFSEDLKFRFAHALYGSKKTKKADSIISELLSKNINTKQFIKKLKTSTPYSYEIEKIKSSKAGDFGMNYFGENVIFSSYKKNDANTYSWNAKPYLDLYQGSLTKDNNVINIKALHPIINSQKHESNAILSKDGKTMYFSRTDKKRRKINGQKVATIKIYKSILKNKKWTKPEKLPFSSDLYSTQHPSLDEVNNRLYFASDMPNGNGGFDIYYVEINKNKFGKPVNLGKRINTKHREQFPYLSKDNVLYFASDGHQGLGGLDVFMSEQSEEGWHTPLNLGVSINTHLDDFSFVVDSDSNTGFVSSNRSGFDNIYAFKRKSSTRTFTVEGKVVDKNTKELLPNTMITLYNSFGKAIDSVKTSEDGNYVFKIKPNKTYTIEGYKPLYIQSIIPFNTNDTGRIEVNIELILESYDDAEEIIIEKEDGYIYIELENIYFDLDKWDIKPQAANTLNVLVDLMKKYPKMEVELGAHTDNRSTAEYNLKLSKNRAKSAIEYLISKGVERRRLKGIGYGVTQLLINCGQDCNENQHAINRRCEFIIIK